MLDLHHISPYPATLCFRNNRRNEAIVRDTPRSLAISQVLSAGFRADSLAG